MNEPIKSKKTPPSPSPLFDTLNNTHLSTPLIALADHQQNDYQHSLRFLHSYRGSEATFNAYRREIERLLHWSWEIAKKSLNMLKRDDILEQFQG